LVTYQERIKLLMEVVGAVTRQTETLLNGAPDSARWPGGIAP
jgi:hypothetical protein